MKKTNHILNIGYINDNSKYLEAACSELELITGSKPVVTKAGQKMGIATVEDMLGTFDIVLFPKVYDKFKEVLQEEAIVAIKGKVSVRDGLSTSINVEYMESMIQPPRMPIEHHLHLNRLESVLATFSEFNHSGNRRLAKHILDMNSVELMKKALEKLE